VIALNICNGCLSSLGEEGKIQSYDGEFVIYVDTDKTGKEIIFKIKDRYYIATK